MLIFTFLAVAIIAPVPVQSIGYWMAAGLVVIGLYVVLVVPRIEEKYKVKRTPRRRKASATEASAGPAQKRSRR